MMFAALCGRFCGERALMILAGGTPIAAREFRSWKEGDGYLGFCPGVTLPGSGGYDDVDFEYFQLKTWTFGAEMFLDWYDNPRNGLPMKRETR